MKNTNFESSLIELEKIVEELEKGNLPLDASMKKFEEGKKHIIKCEADLKKAQDKLTKLSVRK